MIRTASIVEPDAVPSVSGSIFLRMSPPISISHQAGDTAKDPLVFSFLSASFCIMIRRTRGTNAGGTALKILIIEDEQLLATYGQRIDFVDLASLEPLCQALTAAVEDF